VVNTPEVLVHERARTSSDLATAEAGLVWSRYSAMLAANAIVAAAIAVLATAGFSSTELGVAAIGVAAAGGLLISFSWLRLTQYGWHLQEVWVQRASRAWRDAGIDDPYEVKGMGRMQGSNAFAPLRRWAMVPIWSFLLTYATVLGACVGVIAVL